MDIAKSKIKGKSDVAGQATVLIFPDLNTGNNTYKAVQQATGTIGINLTPSLWIESNWRLFFLGAIAMGPLLQGLRKPVNDLSRGCTAADIFNTVLMTAVQAIHNKASQSSQDGS